METKKYNIFSVISFVLGMIAAGSFLYYAKVGFDTGFVVTILCSLLGALLGLIGLSQIDKNSQTQKGRALCILSMLVPVAIFLYFVCFLIILYVFAPQTDIWG